MENDLTLEDREPKKWGVLIGVNFYMPGTARLPVSCSNLSGCVNDIELVEEYLLRHQRFEPCCIWKLTSSIPSSSKPCDPGPERVAGLGSDNEEPPEPKDKWPTYENMIQAFKSVTMKAERGDIVYIHYSGHGGRAVTILPDLKPGNPNRPDRPGIDETLVPTDFNLGGRYLRDIEIAALLKRMVDKGLHVTAVFDSCHSGGAGRNDDERLPDSAVRNISFSRSIAGVLDDGPDWIRLPTDKSDLPEAELKSAVKLEIWRRSDGSKNIWQPQGWVMIAACLPHQVAHEIPMAGQTYGCLTYQLIQILKRAPDNITHNALHRRVREVVEKASRQTPVILGNIGRQLFLSATSDVVHTIAVATVDLYRNQLQLRGGRAQGVYEGDLYGIYSWAASRREDFASPMATVRVTVVRGIDSDAVFEPQLSSLEVGIGSQAVLLERTLPRTNLRLTLMSRPDAPETGSLMLDRLKESDITKYARGSTRVTIENGRNDQSKSKVITLQYYVTMNEQNQYQMYESEDLITITLPPCDTPESLLALATHLGRYHQYLELENPAWPSANFKFEIRASNNYSPEKKAVEIADGDSFTVCFENNTASPLYLTVFDFTSQWGIIRVYPEEGEYEEVDWGHRRDITIEPEFPPQFSSAPYVTETLKAFVTTEPTSFRSLEIPEIDSTFRELELSTQSVSSCEVEPEEQLRHNLSTFDSPQRRTRGPTPPNNDGDARPLRQKGVQSGTGETWQTKGIVVHVYPPLSYLN